MPWAMARLVSAGKSRNVSGDGHFTWCSATSAWVVTMRLLLKGAMTARAVAPDGWRPLMVSAGNDTSMLTATARMS